MAADRAGRGHPALPKAESSPVITAGPPGGRPVVGRVLVIRPAAGEGEGPTSINRPSVHARSLGAPMTIRCTF